MRRCRAVAQLIKTLILAGLISGTQPLTLMGLLLVMGGEKPRRNGFAYIAGAFGIQTILVVTASMVFGATVDGGSSAAHGLLGVRLGLGIGAVLVGALLRRPPGKPLPEIPASLARLQSMGPNKAAAAGVVVADYQGPVIASLTLASADVASSARFGAVAFYTLFATGIPLVLMISATRSAKTLDALNRGTRWVMRNRRKLASWICIVGGGLLALDTVLVLAL